MPGEKGLEAGRRLGLHDVPLGGFFWFIPAIRKKSNSRRRVGTFTRKCLGLRDQQAFPCLCCCCCCCCSVFQHHLEASLVESARACL
jgi:hypothetical protein